MLTFEASTGRVEKFRSAAEIPVCIFWANVAEIHSEVGQQFLYLSSFAMPEGESPYRERMPERVQRWATFARDGLDASALQKP